MANVSQALPPPFEGVSQVEPSIRLLGACETMENCIAVLPGGILPRPPFTFLRQLVNASSSPVVADPYALITLIDRGDPDLDLAFMLNREGSSVKAYLYFTATWDSIPLTISPSAQAYLDAAGSNSKPCQGFRVVTIEDTTFIVNRVVTVTKTADTSPTRPFEALIWVKTGGYARTTTVEVDAPGIPVTVTASFSTGDGSVAAMANAVGTDRIARALYDGTDPAPGNDTPNASPLNALTSNGFTVTLDGSLIYISHPTEDFTLKVSDDAGGAGVVGIKGEVQRFSDLPEVAHEGFTVRIAQEAAGANNDYFVEFRPSSTSTKGVWVEVLEPGSPLGVTDFTLPLRLYNSEIDGLWHIDNPPWKGRTTGNESLSPDPAFLGEEIQDIGWWRGRLELLSFGVHALSSSADPYRYYSTTLSVALSSDPIQQLPPAKGRRRFRQLAVFDERVVVLGDKLQSIVGAGDSVTPTSTYIKPLSDAAFYDLIPAQTCGSKVYFGAQRRNFATIFELGTERISGQQIPTDVSAAIPTYLPATTDRAATLTTEYLTVYASSGSPRMVVHAYRHDDQGVRVQNAWYAWTLPLGYTVGGMFFKGHYLYLSMVNPEGYFTMTRADLSPDQPDDNSSIITYLDLRYTDLALLGGSYDVFTDTTTFDLPAAAEEGLMASLRAPFDDYAEGYPLDVLSIGGSSMTVRGSWLGASLWFGYPYASYFTPSRLYKRGQDGNPELKGRLTIKQLKISVQRGSALDVTVKQRGRPDKTPWSGIAGGDLFMANVAADIYEVTAPIGSRNEDLTLIIGNTSHLGFRIAGLEWYGTWDQKASRVG